MGNVCKIFTASYNFPILSHSLRSYSLTYVKLFTKLKQPVSSIDMTNIDTVYE